MSARRGRPLTRSQGRGQPISAPEAPGESSGDLRQEVTEMRGTLVGIVRAVDRLAANQLKQDQAQQEIDGDPTRKMSARRGRPLTRSQGHGQPISALKASGESSGDLRQEVTEMRGTLVGILRAVDRLTANQLKQDQAQQEIDIDPIGNNDGQNSNPTAQGAGGNAGSQLLKNFMALRPPEFYGGIDVSVAENWMLSVEKHLWFMGCNDAQRVQLATFLLRGDAERWWETARQRYTGREPSWMEFQEAFNENYFPEWIREQKTCEFIELVQGSKTVAQYEAEFISLARYASELVSTEAKKAAKFQRGLCVDIRHALAGARIMDYPIVVQRAYAIERDRNELKIGQAASKGMGTSQGHDNDRKRRWEVGPARNVMGILPCNICGKKHREPCHFVRGVCYFCGQTGHIRRDCPQNPDVTPTREVTCFRCSRKGHKANSCTQPPQYGQRPGG